MDFGTLFKVGAPILSKLFTGGAKGAQDDRNARDIAAANRDRLAVTQANAYEQALENRADLELKQRAADAAAREAGFKGALRAAAIQQWQPAARPNGIPTIAFAHKPDTAALPEYERQMMLRLLNGEQFDDLPPIERIRLSEPSQSSTWEKISGGLGLGFGVLDALNQSGILKRNQSNG